MASQATCTSKPYKSPQAQVKSHKESFPGSAAAGPLGNKSLLIQSFSQKIEVAYCIWRHVPLKDHVPRLRPTVSTWVSCSVRALGAERASADCACRPGVLRFASPRKCGASAVSLRAVLSVLSLSKWEWQYMSFHYSCLRLCMLLGVAEAEPQLSPDCFGPLRFACKRRACQAVGASSTQCKDAECPQLACFRNRLL